MKKVGIIMGSDSDMPVAQKAIDMLKSLDVPYEVHIYSAHRTPVEARDFSLNARKNGLRQKVGARSPPNAARRRRSDELSLRRDGASSPSRRSASRLAALADFHSSHVRRTGSAVRSSKSPVASISAFARSMDSSVTQIVYHSFVARGFETGKDVGRDERGKLW